MADHDPNWVAPRGGHDWRDDDVLLATTWMKSFVPAADWDRRIEAVRQTFLERRQGLLEGRPTQLYEPVDLIAWQIFQAETYATDRRFWTPDAAAQIVPVMTRLGQELPELIKVQDIETRIHRLMTAERRQSDSGLFELLVALAYRRGGWDHVAFVPETPGRGRTPDLHVSRPRRRWAVECKRMGVSPYAAAERVRGEQLARPVHEQALAQSRSIVMEVAYQVELDQVPDSYLLERLDTYLGSPRANRWNDAIGSGQVREVDWGLSRSVLSRDYVYFGASRMIELLVGRYDHDAEHTMAARWRAHPTRPLYADTVYQASVVSWRSQSMDALGRKSRHFRSIVADANRQLPSDMPGVIHVGVENTGDPNVDALRDLRNRLEIRDFKPAPSRLRWVYGNFFAPESTTRPDESAALNETRAWYRIGNHATAQPLPEHLLIAKEGVVRDGAHWDGRSA